MPVLTPDHSSADWRGQLSETKRRHLRLWFWSIAAATFAVVVVGGITRLTQSGLSIVDWQPFVGIVPPLTEADWRQSFERYRQFPQYRQLWPTMTLGEYKFIFFWEYLHRVLARGIGIVFLVPAVVFWWRGYFSRPLAIRALGLFALGSAQGLLGWFMVSSGLVDRPSVSHLRLAAHLTVAFVIFAASIWLARDLTIVEAGSTVSTRTRTLIRRGLAAVGALLVLQIVWGAFVAGLKAGRIYGTFPLMAGHWVPPGLLMMEPWPVNLAQNTVTVQWMHRLLGTLLLAAALILFVRVQRAEPDGPTRYLNTAFVSLIAVQYLLGVLTLLFGVPISLAVVHQALALSIVGVWTVWTHRSTLTSSR